MSEEQVQSRGIVPPTEEDLEAAQNEYLGDIVANVRNTFQLMGLTDGDVAKVGMSLMLNAFLNSYIDIDTSTKELEKMVEGSMRKMRHDEATKRATSLVLPASAMRQ